MGHNKLLQHATFAYSNFFLSAWLQLHDLTFIKSWLLLWEDGNYDESQRQSKISKTLCFELTVVTVIIWERKKLVTLCFPKKNAK